MSSRAGPRWTRARLERVMRLRFGTNRRGHADTAAAAAALGVSQRTVQRWLQGAHGRSRAHLPPAALPSLASDGWHWPESVLWNFSNKA